ncbi:MAG: bifunctional isocitrate dehydrogenase kinase/phosphatase [Myxococcota bacterium]
MALPARPSETAWSIAKTIVVGFDKHYRLFKEISGRAQARFEAGDDRPIDEASRARIGFYDLRVEEAVETLRRDHPEAQRDEKIWQEVKRAYIALLYDHQQPECAETFYNSVACQVLHRTYYRNEYIFWRPAVSTEHIGADRPTYRCYYPASEGLQKTLERMIREFGLTLPWEDLRRDLRFVAHALREAFPAPRELHPNFQIHVLSSLFFRNQEAYAVGRAINDNQAHPFAVPILKTPDGRLVLDALLLRREHVARLFSLARSYFMVEMDVPSAYISFLRSLMPSKPACELYTAVGLQKQGKTLFYRDLDEHLRHSTDRFILAPGVPGMVMLVFTLPSFPYVFKVIRDWFESPKETTKKLVKEKYWLVKHHERVGRMADTLEYSEVAFPLDRLDPTLLAEMQRLAGSSVTIEGDRLILKHLYIERRMTPLDVWLSTANEEDARLAIDEYGCAIKELAAADIFPGDLLLKNFGVTRWGHVVFYDYDEISKLTEVNFRRMPVATNDDQEMSAEPWFTVGPHDVFPEQFAQFVFRAGRHREIFLELHGDLVDPAYWQHTQQQIQAGVHQRHLPYPADQRFIRRYGSRSSVGP